MTNGRTPLTVVLALLLLATAACVPLPPATRAPASPATPLQGPATPLQSTEAAPTTTVAPASNPTAAPVDAATTGGAATTTAPAPDDPLARCPAATDTLQRLVVPEGRYCLAYPAEYKVEKPAAGETILVIGGLLDASHPRLHIRVTDAAGATTERAADQVMADFKDFTLERSTTSVAGESAIVLDQAPGQAINRRILFVHDGLLYDLMFAPADRAAGDASTGMEMLQKQVLRSFAFLPAGVGMANDCLAAVEDKQIYLDGTAGYCLLLPAEYNAKEVGANEVVFSSGSLMDVTKPRLFVRVADANGQTAKEIADAQLAEIQASIPGHKVERPIGVTLGYEAAERLDNVPGQDIGRVLIAVHGPRAYHLTFVPADPNDAGIFQQTETLYDLVVRSFRFTN